MPIEPRKQYSIFSFLTLILLGGAPHPHPLSDVMSRRIDLLWGDLHVHTSYSPDANVFGTLATPADAYRFAKGGPLTQADGTTVKLARPLDFVAVTEHAEWLDFTVNLRRSERVFLRRLPEPVVQPFTRERLTTLQGVRSHNNNGT